MIDPRESGKKSIAILLIKPMAKNIRPSLEAKMAVLIRPVFSGLGFCLSSATDILQ